MSASSAPPSPSASPDLSARLPLSAARSLPARRHTAALLVAVAPWLAPAHAQPLADDLPAPGRQPDWQPAAPPSAWQRLFRPDLPRPAPNPFGLPTMAAAVRAFPEHSRLGTMTPGVFPLVSINGVAARFGAGATVRDQSNMLVMPASLANAAWPVRYTVDAGGNIGQAWILTDAELAAEARRPRAVAGTASAR